MTKEERNQQRLLRRVQKYLAATNKAAALYKEASEHLDFIIAHAQIGQEWCLPETQERVYLANNAADGNEWWQSTKCRLLAIKPVPKTRPKKV